MKPLGALWAICVFTRILIAGNGVEERLDGPVRLLALEDGETVAACQTFQWSAGRSANQYWLRVGSCPNCADLFDQSAGAALSLPVNLPADGRRIHVRLFSEVEQLWYWSDYSFTAPAHRSDGSCEAPFRAKVGFYHWAGTATRSMQQGVTAVRDLGGMVARVTLSPRYYSDYNLGASCYEDFTLRKLAEEPDVRGSLAEPAIRVVLLTAFDGVSFGDCATLRFLNPWFYTEENAAAMREEYAEFTYHLVQAHSGSGKRFILSNWEGDNALYCGQAYRYAADPEFRQWCNDNYPNLYNGNQSPEDSIEGMRRWFRTRWEGVRAGTRRAAAAGYGGVTVRVAPEISMVRSLRENGLRSVLYDVVPFVPFDYISYSAYESLNRPEPDMALKADLDTIAQAAGAATIILGEIGYARHYWGERTVELTDRAIAAALDWGVSYIVQWSVYDTDPTADLGLFDANGALTPLGEYYTRKLTAASRN
jgi:hypothetical protein